MQVLWLPSAFKNRRCKLWHEKQRYKCSVLERAAKMGEVVGEAALELNDNVNNDQINRPLGFKLIKYPFILSLLLGIVGGAVVQIVWSFHLNDADFKIEKFDHNSTQTNNTEFDELMMHRSEVAIWSWISIFGILICIGGLNAAVKESTQWTLFIICALVVSLLIAFIDYLLVPIPEALKTLTIIVVLYHIFVVTLASTFVYLLKSEMKLPVSPSKRTEPLMSSNVNAV